MIIKGCEGIDWAIVVGHWTGLRSGVPGTLSKRGIPGSSGELVLRIYCPVNEPPTIVTLPYSKNSYEFTVRSCRLDMKTGNIKVRYFIYIRTFYVSIIPCVVFI